MSEAAPARPQASSSAENPAAWTQIEGLPCVLSVELTLPGVRVHDLMTLARGAVLDSHWPTSDDVPLRVNGELVAWSEFEVVGKSLAVRLTELA